MSAEMCRLCLSKDELKSIFPDIEDSDKVTAVLELFTGLKIEVNDGLPQQICKECTDTINKFLTFRNRSHATEIELIKLGFNRRDPMKQEVLDITASLDNGFVDFNKQFKIEVELDRITQVDDASDHEEDDSDLQNTESNSNKKTSRKAVYENFVEGEFVPNLFPVICKVCKKSYSQWNSFVSHVRMHLKKGVSLENEIDTADIKTESLVDKQDTEVKTAKRKSRKEVRQQYLSLVEGDLDPNGPVKCKVCKKTLNRWNSFMNHARKHLGFKIVCEFCGKSFASSNQLKRHCRSFHGMQSRGRQIVQFGWKKRSEKVHERREHTGERPFVCDLCAAAYFSRKCLLQHIESHRTTASVQCDKCPLTFKSRRHLAKHMYGTHSDKRRERRRERRNANKVIC
ncbi:zinc-finger associated domain (zf-AD) domain-containing protein [Phthorimaea operculella]|nr:zinc-finger associated domain (zf-AD) domain-containing protein [Phthorimaea operculella]